MIRINVASYSLHICFVNICSKIKCQLYSVPKLLIATMSLPNISRYSSYILQHLFLNILLTLYRVPKTENHSSPHGNISSYCTIIVFHSHCFLWNFFVESIIFPLYSILETTNMETWIYHPEHYLQYFPWSRTFKKTKILKAVVVQFLQGNK